MNQLLKLEKENIAAYYECCEIEIGLSCSF